MASPEAALKSILSIETCHHLPPIFSYTFQLFISSPFFTLPFPSPHHTPHPMHNTPNMAIVCSCTMLPACLSLSALQAKPSLWLYRGLRSSLSAASLAVSLRFGSFSFIAFLFYMVQLCCCFQKKLLPAVGAARLLAYDKRQPRSFRMMTRSTAVFRSTSSPFYSFPLKTAPPLFM